MINSYSKIYGLGHRAITLLFMGNIVIQEKIDGSQFSFGKLDSIVRFRSKRVEMFPNNDNGMFNKGIQAVLEVANMLPEGIVYRGEYLQKPKHNTLAYDRIPHNHVVLFDMATAGQNYFSPEMVAEEANRLGFEPVPTIFNGNGSHFDQETFTELIDRTSVLGGAKIEGVVIKNYGQFTADGKVMMGKYVAEHFREKNGKVRKNKNVSNNGIIGQLGEMYRTEARWRKAIEHLRDEGVLEDSPRDIGPLMRELSIDFETECADEIKEALYKWARKAILRRVQYGFPEFYKNLLMEKQFESSHE